MPTASDAGFRPGIKLPNRPPTRTTMRPARMQPRTSPMEKVIAFPMENMSTRYQGTLLGILPIRGSGASTIVEEGTVEVTSHPSSSESVLTTMTLVIKSPGSPPCLGWWWLRLFMEGFGFLGTLGRSVGRHILSRQKGHFGIFMLAGQPKNPKP